MAKIPVIESTEQLTTQAPGVRVGRGAFAGGGKALVEIGRVLEANALRLEEARRDNETIKADTEARRRLKDLEIEAEGKTEDFNPQPFQERITKIKQEILETIKIPGARNKFNIAFDRVSLVSDSNIRRTLRGKQLVENKANTLENLEELKDTFIRTAGSAQEQQFLIQQRKQLIQKSITNGTFDKLQAFKLEEKLDKDWKEAEIRNTIATDAELARDALSAGEFPELSADETAKWIQVAQTQIDRNKRIANKIHDEKWLKNGGAVIENLKETSVEDLIQLIATDEISPELGNDLIEWKTDDESVQYETNEKIWMEIVRDSVSPKQDLRKFQNRIAKAVANKQIQAVEAANLSVKVRGLFEEAIAFKTRPSLRDRLLKTAYDLFEVQFPTTNIVFNLMKDFNKKLQKDNIPDDKILETGVNILKDEIRKQNPEISNLEDIPNSIFENQKGFNNVSNSKSKIEAEWKFIDGKMIKNPKSKK